MMLEKMTVLIVQLILMPTTEKAVRVLPVHKDVHHQQELLDVVRAVRVEGKKAMILKHLFVSNASLEK